MKTEKNRWFPLFTDLTRKKAVVFGGGKIAARRIHTLLEFAGEIVVIAPDVQPEIERLSETGDVTWIRKAYEREDLYDADMVLAATNDHQVNNDIYSACKCLGILVNTASDRTKCDFHFPGIICDGEVVIGIHAGGSNHGKAKETRENIERFLKDAGGKS